MYAKKIIIGLTLLFAAAPLSAQQQRGTIEFGGFASSTDFDRDLAGANDGLGAGGRIGAFLSPRLSLEIEAGGTTASFGVFSARVLAAPLQMGRVSLLLGAGGDHTDVDVLKSYGVHGLVGAKLAISEALAVRVGWTQYYLVNGDAMNRNLHIGLSVFRSPGASTFQ